MNKVIIAGALVVGLVVGAVAGAWWKGSDESSLSPSATPSKVEKLCERMLIERARIKDQAEARTMDLDPGFVEAAAEVPELRHEAVALLNDPAARPDGFWAATGGLAQHCAKLLISARASSRGKDLCRQVLQVPEGEEPSQELLGQLVDSREFTGYIGGSINGGPRHFATSGLRPRCLDIVSP